VYGLGAKEAPNMFNGAFLLKRADYRYYSAVAVIVEAPDETLLPSDSEPVRLPLPYRFAHARHDVALSSRVTSVACDLSPARMTLVREYEVRSEYHATNVRIL